MIAITSKGSIKVATIDLSDITLKADFLPCDRTFSRYTRETEKDCFVRVCERVCDEYGTHVKDFLI